jgi:hypothetical protein
MIKFACSMTNTDTFDHATNTKDIGEHRQSFASPET